MISERYARAVAFATKAHAGQLRTGTAIPYIYHPIAVSTLVLQYGGDEEQAIGGLLHDVVEDCGVTFDEIEQLFGDRAAAIVRSCTDGLPDQDGDKGPWLERKLRYIQHMGEAGEDALLVSACDKLHNARAIVEDIRNVGCSVFDRFTATRDQTVWYYRSLAGVFRRRLKRDDVVRALEHEIQTMTDFGLQEDCFGI